MARGNLPYVIIGALLVALVVVGFQLYRAQQQPEGVQINVGPGGLTVDTK